MPADDACVQPDKSRKVDVGFVLYVFVHSEGRFPQVSQALLEHPPPGLFAGFPQVSTDFPQVSVRACGGNLVSLPYGPMVHKLF